MAESPYLMPTYAHQDVSFIRGEGVWLYDSRNQAYLDALCGIAVTSLGHNHPAITHAIIDQAAQLLHTSNGFHIPLQEQLAETLVKLSGLQAAFFSNSGAEANEAAIKLCRLAGHHKSYTNPSIIVMEQSFHGRTLATLTASGSRAVQAGFEPLVQGFVRAPFDDIEALHKIAQNNSQVVAVMVEPIQGESGIHVPSSGYLAALREICDQYDWLLVLDEIQCGMGRTGKMFAYQHADILPDIVTLAKALGNGVPIGATLVNRKANIFKPGNHGTTFGGNPLVCRVALAVIDTLLNDGILDNAAKVGAYLQQGITSMCQPWLDNGDIVAVRGKGMMLGIETQKPCGDIRKLGLDERLLFTVSHNQVIRLLPPLIMTQKDADELIKRLEKTLRRFFNT